jgi:hypothetical protein
MESTLGIGIHDNATVLRVNIIAIMHFWVHFQSSCCNLMPCMCSSTKKAKGCVGNEESERDFILVCQFTVGVSEGHIISVCCFELFCSPYQLV